MALTDRSLTVAKHRARIKKMGGGRNIQKSASFHRRNKIMRLCQLSNAEDSESSITVLNTQSAHDLTRS